MSNEVNKKQTLGKFDITGHISVDGKVFTLGSKSKNNPTWVSHIFNPRIEGANGASMFIRIQDGYDSAKGKTIYARSTDDKQMEIAFGDRNNQAILERVNDMSFIKVFFKRVEKENESGKKYTTWEEPKKFLTMYDAIEFLNQIMPLGFKKKVRLFGDLRYSEYNGKAQRNFEVKTIYILTDNEEEGSERPLEFKFTQNIIIMGDAADTTRLDDEGVLTINAKLYVKKPKTKDKYELLNLPLVMRTNEEKGKEIYRQVANKYFTADTDKVRRVNVEGIFQCGYVSANVTQGELPEEALELIAEGLYSEEEVMKLYAKKEKVDELVVKRPIAKIVDGRPQVDMDETTYSMADIELAMKENDDEVVKFDDEDNSLLLELENF